MRQLFLILQIIITVSVIGLILLQSSKGGLSTSLGGGEMYRTRRGAERAIFMVTIVAAGLFLIISVLNLFAR